MIGGRQLAASAKTELLENMREVELDRRLADGQTAHEFLVGESGRGVPEDFALPVAQALRERGFARVARVDFRF